MESQQNKVTILLDSFNNEKLNTDISEALIKLEEIKLLEMRTRNISTSLNTIDERKQTLMNTTDIDAQLKHLAADTSKMTEIRMELTKYEMDMEELATKLETFENRIRDVNTNMSRSPTDTPSMYHTDEKTRYILSPVEHGGKYQQEAVQN